ncbi:hypothetical protein PCANB_002426 [Pneumocystis canis]|nr:hypothetical protein PCK1_002548 [Pneumocystis canis]KAG5438706.1 hypothetical protein PCANB_002426 [Pneumocystis canis]
MSFQDKLQVHVSSLDKELSKCSYLNHFERQSGIKKVYVVGGIISFYFFLIFINWGGRFLSNVLGCVLPIYYSILAIESSNKAKNIQWLAYWIIYACLILIEHYEYSILYWLPFYYFFKTLFILYLSLPQFNGAQTIYWTAIHPFYIKYFIKSSSSDSSVSQNNNNNTIKEDTTHSHSQ